ncbi:MAG: ACP S-malonyltransferase [Sedimentisphaerales bacterium]|nr:ACP S-malonyltransferase [Sedimentisphaerales bacterium]
MKTAFLFPGQGAQFVEMGADIARSFEKAAEVFKQANDILGFDLTGICFEGPAEELNSTAISQPAIFTTSAAILEVMRAELPPDSFLADVTAGLSLGEYTALYAAGVLSFEDALVLVNKRGKAMQAAADANGGAMVSIIGLEEEQVRMLCADIIENSGGQSEQMFLEPVNFNCPGQIVVSGTKSACKSAKEMAVKVGAIKAVRLDVAGAFHTRLMAPAADALGEALSQSKIAEPSRTRIIANINAEYYQSSEEIARGLIKQLTSPILWQKCMERLIEDGVEDFYEIGPGRVLTSLMKRINRKAKVNNISSAQSLKEILPH